MKTYQACRFCGEPLLLDVLNEPEECMRCAPFERWIAEDARKHWEAKAKQAATWASFEQAMAECSGLPSGVDCFGNPSQSVPTWRGWGIDGHAPRVSEPSE